MEVAVIRFSRPDRRKPVPPKAAHRGHALRSARALLLGVLVSALPTVLAAPPVLAQVNNWGGDVLVSDSSISVAPGESVTYSVRLNRKPTETDGTVLDNEIVEWFVMVHTNGVRYQNGEYKDLTLIPSFYRTFTGKDDPNYPNDDGDWDEWKDFRIYRASYNDWEGRGKQPSERATSVTLTHEVWDHNANCPVHRRSPVTVGIGGSTPPPDNNGGPPGDTNENGGHWRNGGNDGDDENGGSSDTGGNDGDDENGGSSDTGGNDGDDENGGSSDTGGNRVAPTASISDAAGVEGEVLRFEVTLSRSSGTPVTVRYETAGGTALEGTDYDAESGTLTFGPGATRRTIQVRTREDTADEPNENFTVTLSSPSGATLRDEGAVGTIIDDDAPDPAGPALTVSDARAREGEILRFQVILTPPGSETVTVDYQTASGTAVEGLDYIAAGSRLTFEPGIAQQTVEVRTRKDDIDESNETLTLRLSNAYGARLQDAVGTGTIIGALARRIRLVNRAYLPEVARAIAFNAVRCRIDRALSRTASGNLKQALDRLAPPPPASFGWSPARSRSVSIDELLGRLSFALQSTGGANGIGRVSAWSCGDYRALADGKSGGPVDWDGKVVGLQAGADVRLRPDLLAGLAVSRFNGTFRYDVGDGAAKIGGRDRLRLNGLHPYLAWKASPYLTVWATIGHSWGDLEMADDVEGDRRAGHARLGSGMLGLNGRLLERGTTTVRFKGETGLAQFKIADAGVGFDAVVSDLRRLRLAIESAHEQPLPTGGTLRPWGEIGLFHDGGDGETGVGLELGGGLRYRNQTKGWSAEVFGRRRMVHGDALPREWGAGAAFRIDPGPADLGFSAILNQSWGRTGSGVERLWDQGSEDTASGSLWGGRMELQLGYGFGALGGRGVLTPYGAVTFRQGSDQSYRWGGRLEAGSGVALSLEAERRENDNAEPEHAIMLRGLLRFHPGEASR